MIMADDSDTVDWSSKTATGGEKLISAGTDIKHADSRALPLASLELQSSSSHLSPQSQAPRSSTTKRPQLQSQPTTALSSIDIQTLSFPDGSRGTFSTPDAQPYPVSTSEFRNGARNGSDVDDSASLISCAPTSRTGGDLESLVGDGLNQNSPAWKLLSSQTDSANTFEKIDFNEDDGLSAFEREFDEVADVDSKGGNEGLLSDCLKAWPWLTLRRGVYFTMEIQTKALSDPFFGGKTDL